MGMYVIAFFVSPLYFLIRGKWGGFVINLFLYLLAIFTVFFGIGVFFWAFGVAHAFFHLRKELMKEQAVMIAEEMAKRMNKS